MPVRQYDYIIAGAGAAGLSLLVRLIGTGKFSDKKILLADKMPKTLNDRTWCFWDKGDGIFKEVVCKSWNHLWFYGEDFSREFDISPYRYNMIRGIDFYDHCFDIIRTQPNITIQFGNISEIDSDEQSSWIIFEGQKVTARFIFNSIIFSRPVLKKNEFFLAQHFKGWVIETEKEVFNSTQATLMDFRTDQQHGTTFIYVMPFSATSALVEYTLFSKDILPQDQYDQGLKDYIHHYLNCSEYSVISEEYGIIPMTNYKFPHSKGNIINIGTAGGQTKASSGYTFQFIQKSTETIVNQLLNNKKPDKSTISKKFHFYDSVLLNVLATGKLPGKHVFTQMFKKNSSQRIFKFLDNESSLLEDIGIITSLPTLPFLKAGLQQL